MKFRSWGNFYKVGNEKKFKETWRVIDSARNYSFGRLPVSTIAAFIGRLFAILKLKEIFYLTRFAQRVFKKKFYDVFVKLWWRKIDF